MKMGYNPTIDRSATTIRVNLDLHNCTNLANELGQHPVEMRFSRSFSFLDMRKITRLNRAEVRPNKTNQDAMVDIQQLCIDSKLNNEIISKSELCEVKIIHECCSITF